MRAVPTRRRTVRRVHIAEVAAGDAVCAYVAIAAREFARDARHAREHNV